jgi:hypothetical protein
VSDSGGRIGPAGAKLVGFCALALENQVIVLLRGGGGRIGTRLLHHAYDAGQLVALGLFSFLGSLLAGRLIERVPRLGNTLLTRAGLLATAVFFVSLATVTDDVTNAAGRYGLPLTVAVLAASLAFAVALGVTAFLGALTNRRARAALAVAGLTTGAANAFVLRGDYPAVHLMLGWFSALLVAQGVEGAPFSLPRALSLRARHLSLVALAVLSLATVTVPPPQAVRRQLLALPSALVAPFALHLLPEPGTDNLTLVPREVRRSPWFKKRSKLSPTPPTNAVPKPELVLLLTIDATRADVLSNRAHRKKLPNLSRLAKESAWFTEARTAASSTRPAMSSLFTGRYYSQLRFGTKNGRAFLKDAGDHLPDVLTRERIATVSLPLLYRVGSESGVGRGFRDEFRNVTGAKATVNKIIELTSRLNRPTFLYAHFGEPHAPYRGAGNTPFERYLSEVADVDREIGRLLAHLEKSGLHRRTLLVISADHGEAFFEHGVGNHSRVIYEEVARIPLLVRGPGVVPRVIDEPVSLVDLAPTVLDAFGLPAPAVYMGQSLLPLAAGGSNKLGRPIAIQATHGLAGLYVGNLKVIFDFHARTIEVYDIVSDPGETVNLADEPNDAVESAIQTAKLFMKVHGRARRSFDAGGD